MHTKLVILFQQLRFTMAFEREFTKNIPDKLEHLSLSPIYKKLINLCLIFTYNSSEKYCCDQFKGC